jgi:hypothetical protein
MLGLGTIAAGQQQQQLIAAGLQPNIGDAVTQMKR